MDNIIMFTEIQRKAPWRKGDVSVYSSVLDKRLWINPETQKRLGEEKAASFTLKRSESFWLTIPALAKRMTQYLEVKLTIIENHKGV